MNSTIIPTYPEYKKVISIIDNKQVSAYGESTPEFQGKRRRHAGIESCIHCLEQHGGDRIRTKGGKDGFARTIGASVVATNLCRIGMVLIKRERTLLRRAT